MATDSESTGQATATAEAPARHGWGGRRPGAGRPRKVREGAESSKAAARIDVGDPVWFWEHTDTYPPKLVPRAGLVLARADAPGILHLMVLRHDREHDMATAPPATAPTVGRWTLPPSRGGPPRPA